MAVVRQRRCAHQPSVGGPGHVLSVCMCARIQIALVHAKQQIVSQLLRIKECLLHASDQCKFERCLGTALFWRAQKWYHNTGRVVHVHGWAPLGLVSHETLHIDSARPVQTREGRRTGRYAHGACDFARMSGVRMRASGAGFACSHEAECVEKRALADIRHAYHEEAHARFGCRSVLGRA